MSAEMQDSTSTTRSNTAAPEERRLEGNLGTMDIVFTVLAFNAPLSVFVGFVPVIIGVGNGLGAPIAYLAAGLLILLFAVGFTAMGRKLPNAGAFYAYITAGLGRPIGLGAAFLAVVSYIFVLVGGYAFGGIVLEALVRDVLGGPDITWWAWVLVLMATAGTLGYFKISLSAKILTVTMTLELIVVVAYNAVVFATGGQDGQTGAPLVVSNIFSGNLGLAALFGIVCFSGFEATAVFREEARDPARTVPRATYIAIITMAVLYATSAWAMITGIGTSAVVDASASDPTGTVFASIQQYLGNVAVDLVNVLLVTSIFAANLATHNVTTRYLYSLSVDRVFHPRLGRVHARHGSPHVASIATSIIAVAFLTVLVLARSDGATIYAVLVGIGGYALILLMLLTSIAVVRFFAADRTGSLSWSRTIAPVIAALGLVGALALASANLGTMVGGNQALASGLMMLFYTCLVVGVVYALILRRRSPEVYQRIGRQDV
ncbi:APC family permease [Kineococcus rhizosphaerae]|uniref:Amino acid/polyamine/organocation transporter (APC superfamily) n=1 Tax=Kineococcus rhizosphaerae TaxID=559628 RepID=A0A2T0QUY4_9ACTN|nr:APC family permease [Kineococcus rhizosphaerae]PRY08935.1 amino acid/polyamine/organocation transporter (APC superfamily) [Kineococcus rhizosphaerae]